MYIQGSPCCNNGLIEVANSMEDIGHSEVAHVSSLVRGIVDGPATVSYTHLTLPTIYSV